MLVARDLWVCPPGSAEPVVRGASLEVARGEWLAITGPNGGGKSTLLLALAGLLPVRQGRLELDGLPFGPGAGDGRRAVSVVLQDLPSQLLQRSVAEEIGFGPRNLGWPEADVARAVRDWSARLGLDPVLERDPAELSAGYQQLTLLAAAMAARPQTMLVDEGGAHLDPFARRRVLAAFREEVAGGLALVWVTQEQDEIAAADRSLFVGDAGAGPVLEGGPEADTTRTVSRSEPDREAGSRPAGARVVIAAFTAGSVERGPRVAVATEARFDVPDRGVIAIEGGNGSGKTTLLGALAGGRGCCQVSVEWLGPTGPGPILAAQHPEEQVFAEEVEEEVLFAATQRGLSVDDARARAMFHFEALGLPAGFIERRTWTLSLGEKRLLQVVAALIAPSDLVLLDEPTSGLDPDRKSALGRLIALRARSVPVIVAGHDGEWVEGLASSRIKLGFELASPSKKTD